MGIFNKGNNWFIDYRVNGIRKREKIGPSKELANSVLQKRLVEIAEGKFLDIEKRKNVIFNEIVEDFMNYSQNNKRSAERDKYLVRHLLGFFGKKLLENITPALIEKYKNMRLNDGKKPATVNREIACLKCMFNLALRNKKAKENPMHYVKLLKEDNTRIRYLKEEEFIKLLNACPRCIKPIVITALLTGMRRGEILDLKWDDINFTNNVILLRHTKSGRWREIPISSSLLKVLEECRNNTDGEYVFCNEQGQHYRKIDDLFQSIVKRSGIKDFHFHDLRHTAASYMVMSGVDLISVKEILGHSKIDTTLRYAHLSPNHKRQAVEVLASKMDTFWTPEGVGSKQPDAFIVDRRGTQVAEGAGLLNL